MKKKKIVLDATVFDLGGFIPETRVSTREVLNEGTKDEVRQVLYLLGMLLKTRQPQVPEKDPEWLLNQNAEWLGEALCKISKGEDANKALGLTRKRRISIQQVKNYAYLVDDLKRQWIAQGETRSDAEEKALDMVARYDHESGALELHEKGSDPVEALRQLLKRNKHLHKKTK